MVSFFILLQDILDYLPSCPSTLSAAYRVGLESDAFDWSESVAMETSKNKRPKLESGISGRGLSLSTRLCIWDVIQCIVDGKGVKPTSLNTLSSSDDNKDIIDYILTVSQGKYISRLTFRKFIEVGQNLNLKVYRVIVVCILAYWQTNSKGGKTLAIGGEGGQEDCRTDLNIIYETY